MWETGQQVFVISTNMWTLWECPPFTHQHNFVPSKVTASLLYWEKLSTSKRIKSFCRTKTQSDPSSNLTSLSSGAFSGKTQKEKPTKSTTRLFLQMQRVMLTIKQLHDHNVWLGFPNFTTHKCHNWFLYTNYSSLISVKREGHTGICSYAHGAQWWKAIHQN